jgi:type I restriction enzyme S subunit
MIDAEELPQGWGLKTLRQCVAPKQLWKPSREPRDRIRYVELSGIDNERGVITDFSELAADDAPSRARKIVRSGDIIFATTRPNLRNIAVVPPELDGEICSTGFCVLRPLADVATSGWLFALCRSDVVVSQVIKHDEKNAYPSVSDDEVLDALVPVPSLPEQRRLVARIEALTSRLDELRRLRTETEAELVAFTPALFAKAFRGEL